MYRLTMNSFPQQMKMLIIVNTLSMFQALLCVFHIAPSSLKFIYYSILWTVKDKHNWTLVKAVTPGFMQLLLTAGEMLSSPLICAEGMGILKGE